MSENPFERFAALGYATLVPVIPPGAPISERSSLFKRIGTDQDARGKTPGIKWRDGTWSSFDWAPYAADARDYRRWHAMGAGVGIKTGAGLVAIDADTMDERSAGIIRDTVEAAFGRLPIRVGQYPKALYPIRVSAPMRYARVEFGPPRDPENVRSGRKWRVEVLSEGRFFVAHGVHPKTGKGYEWKQPLSPLADLPEATPQQIEALLDTLRELLPDTGPLIREGGDGAVNQAALRGDPDAVRRAVEALPNTSDHFPSRESYLGLGFAIKAALPDAEADALALFEDWCARWADGENDPDVVRSDWSRMRPPFRRGAGWLYELGEELSGGAFSVASVWLDNLDTPANPFAALAAEAVTATKSHTDGDAPMRLTFTPFAEAAESALAVAAKPLIKGLLDQGAMTVLYGASNTGKTFVALDAAFHVATDRDWGGMKVTPGMSVVYVAAEGGVGARKRAAALRVKYGTPVDGRFTFLLAPINLLKPDADLKPLIDMVRALGVRVGLVVIDTLSRAMAGGDENASTDMGAMVRHLDILRKATDAHLLVVHHSGKDLMKGARGWSGLRAATDTEIEIADGVITVTKQRDLDREWSSAFVLDVVELGRDADGDPVTSCTVRLMRETEAPPAAATRKEDAIVQAVTAILATRDTTAEAGVSIAEIIAYLGADADKAGEKAARMHVLAAHNKKLLRRVGRGQYTLSAMAMLNSPLNANFGVKNAKKIDLGIRFGHDVENECQDECQDASVGIFG